MKTHVIATSTRETLQKYQRREEEQKTKRKIKIIIISAINYCHFPKTC